MPEEIKQNKEEEITSPIHEEAVPKDLPSDDNLVEMISRWEVESKPYNDELRKEQDFCEQYYLGNQTMRNYVPQFLSNHVTNRIFEAIETAVPIITAKSPEFIALPAQEDEESALLADKTQKVLSELFDKLDIKEKLETVVRHFLLFRFGVLKPFWNEIKKNIDVRYVRPQLIYIPRYGQSVDELPYILEDQSYTYQDLVDNFGAEKALSLLVTTSEGKPGEPKKLYQVWEASTDHWTVWKCGNKILKKDKNLYYNFEDESENYFEFPKKPYVFLATFPYAKGMVSSPSIAYQGIPLQDAINTITRKIIDHAVKMGNGAWMIDSEVMTFEEAKEKINNAAGIIIHGKGAARQDMVRRDAPVPLPNYFIVLLAQLNSHFDNLFGLHSTTRGERGSQETATGRQLLKQADLGRLDAFVRITERAIDDLGEWLLQLMKLFYDTEHVFPILGEDGSAEFIKFKKESIQKGMKVKVRHGSTLPTDPEVEANRVIQLWQLGAIDPITLYKKLNYSNPEALAQKLMLFKTGQLFPQPQPQVAAGVPPQAGGGRQVITP